MISRFAHTETGRGAQAPSGCQPQGGVEAPFLSDRQPHRVPSAVLLGTRSTAVAAKRPVWLPQQHVSPPAEMNPPAFRYYFLLLSLVFLNLHSGDVIFLGFSLPVAVSTQCRCHVGPHRGKKEEVGGRCRGGGADSRSLNRVCRLWRGSSAAETRARCLTVCQSASRSLPT